MRCKMHIYRLNSERLVVFAYCLYVATGILGSTQFANISGWDYVYTARNALCVLCVLISFILNSKQTKSALVSYIIIAVVGAMAAISSNHISQLALIVLFLISARFIKSDCFLKKYCTVTICIILFTLLMYAAGLYEYDAVITESRERLYLGFKYTTYLANYFFHLLLVYFAIDDKKISLDETAFIMLLNWIIFEWTDTKAVYYEVYLLLFLLWGLRIFPNVYKGNLFKIGTIMIMPVLAVLCIWLAYIYTPYNAGLVFLDGLLTTRLSLGHSAIMQYGLTWLGNKIVWVTGRYGIERTEAYFYVDASYINIALSYGIVTLIVVLLGFICLNRRAILEQKYSLSISLIMLSIHSFSDPQLFDLKYDPFLILAAYAVMQKHPLPIGSLVYVQRNGISIKEIRKFSTGKYDSKPYNIQELQ